MAAVVATIAVDRPAPEVFAYATDPSPFAAWQQGVVDGHSEPSGTPPVGAHCRTVRRIGGADRSATSEVTHLDAPRSWRIRGIDGPVRAAVDVRVDSMTETRSRLTIAVDFEDTASAACSSRW